jgi:hypothetical protein
VTGYLPPNPHKICAGIVARIENEILGVPLHGMPIWRTKSRRKLSNNKFDLQQIDRCECR